MNGCCIVGARPLKEGSVYVRGVGVGGVLLLDLLLRVGVASPVVNRLLLSVVVVVEGVGVVERG